MHKLFFAIFALFLLIACNKTDAPEANIHEPSSAPVVISNKATSNNALDGTFCFSKIWNKDITDVRLAIVGDAVTGVMNWIPYEKDGARGTLTGTTNAAGEFDLMYDYIIEGSQQTETKIMKIEDGKLLIKMGELQDLKYDGNLTYKDVSQAKYSETLEKVDCKN
jgi:hypothetical protein